MKDVSPKHFHFIIWFVFVNDWIFQILLFTSASISSNCWNNLITLSLFLMNDNRLIPSLYQIRKQLNHKEEHCEQYTCWYSRRMKTKELFCQWSIQYILLHSIFYNQFIYTNDSLNSCSRYSWENRLLLVNRHHIHCISGMDNHSRIWTMIRNGIK